MHVFCNAFTIVLCNAFAIVFGRQAVDHPFSSISPPPLAQSAAAQASLSRVA
jgi:hypothetical protein